ncbi:MAG: SIMPL domain-containing protein [Desulfobacterales bacterium]|nr:SIMPL domain-containing protein [Desulfobacterales bacterium]
MILGCLLITAVAAAAPPQIKVFGTSEVTVEPDRAVVRLTIKNKAHAPDITAELHRKILESVRSILTASGAALEDTNIQGPYAGLENTSLSSVSSVSAVVVNLAAIPKLVHKLSGKPGVRVTGVEYGHSAMAELIENAEADALLNAGKKALGYTRTLGATLGEAVFIQEIDPDPDRNVAEGIPDIRIRKKMEVVFRLKTPGCFAPWDKQFGACDCKTKSDVRN